MKKPLTPAPESMFWYWIRERHAIYLRRQAGQPKPWTQDPILQQYKFCNVFRELDTGTVWLRENFLEPHKNDSFDLLAFNICWYRMFNWWPTGEFLGWQTSWNEDFVIDQLTERQAAGHQIFTGAHIVRSKNGLPKIDATVHVCTELWHRRGFISGMAIMTRRLETVFHELNKIDYIGPFMAYEMVTDMRHTILLDRAEDIMTWANPGNGAIRGLQRLGMNVGAGHAIASMRELLARSAQELPEDFPPLEMRDIEHSLCEFDKYARVKFGEGEPRSRYAGVI